MGLVYRAYLPKPKSPDVVRRELAVTVNGVTTTYSATPQHSLLDLDSIPRDCAVSIALRDIDSAGNFIDWGDPYEFETKYTMRPNEPNAVMLELRAEVPDETTPSKPEPEVAPTAPEPEVSPEPEEIVEN